MMVGESALLLLHVSRPLDATRRPYFGVWLLHYNHGHCWAGAERSQYNDCEALETKHAVAAVAATATKCVPRSHRVVWASNKAEALSDFSASPQQTGMIMMH